MKTLSFKQKKVSNTPLALLGWSPRKCKFPKSPRIGFFKLLCVLFLLTYQGSDAQNVSSRQSQAAVNVDGYASNPAGSVNTWWIETDKGLVLIDAQRSAHETKLAIVEIKKTEKPVLAILLTHSHSDHTGGLAVFKEEYGEDLPIYGSTTTIHMLEEDPTGDIYFTELYMGPDYPDETIIPDHILKDGETLVFGETKIDVSLYGAAEDHGSSAFYVKDANALFIGDIASNEMIPYMLDANTGPWLDQIDEVKKKFPASVSVYPGHGRAGTFEMLDKTSDYIKLIRNEVKSKGNGSSTLTDGEIAEIVAKVTKMHPPNFSENGWMPVASLPNLIALNVKAVAHELGRLPGKAPTLGDMANMPKKD